MNARRSAPRSLFVALTAGVLLLLAAGCANPFIVKHKVFVDAIAAPGVQKPAGKSYRLVAKKSVVGQVQAQVAVVKACIDAALTAQGMFEAPPTVPPDIVIEVGYGIDTSPRVNASSRETFLQLSARSNPARALDRATGPEVWDVRVAVLGLLGRMENAMPLLSSVASDYIATDTKFETKIEIPQNSPTVKLVRESAIKSLEEKVGAAKEGGAPAPEPAPPAATGGGSGPGTAATVGAAPAGVR